MKEVVYESKGSSIRIQFEEDGIVPIAELLAKVEREMLLWMIAGCFSNKTKAAKRLCLNRTTLIEKCRRYGIHLRAPLRGWKL